MENLKKAQKKEEKLIPDLELRESYKKYGLCTECQQPNTGHEWCQVCNAQRFQENFKSWTSGNEEIDKMIQRRQSEATNCFNTLEWIPYEQFTNIEYLAQGGFGKVYKAHWNNSYIIRWSTTDNKWERSKYSKGIVLKALNNSQNMAVDFLHEITCYKLFSREFNHIVRCYGVSRDPLTNDYLMVIQYVQGGNLRQYLHDNYGKLGFRAKFMQLQTIARGLNFIHEQGLIHRDFHPGNILNQVIGENVLCYITDLGLCQPVNKKGDRKVYGVLPYVAPEILGKTKYYTQATDIYSFGIVAYEVLTGLPPYVFYDEEKSCYKEVAHDIDLALLICQGLRPQFQIKIPQLLEDLIRSCWDAEPLKRPTACNLYEILNNWGEIWVGTLNKKNKEFAQQHQEAETVNQSLSTAAKELASLSYQNLHTIYTSKLLEFPSLPKPQNSKEINEKLCNLEDSRQLDLELNTQLLENLQISEDHQFENSARTQIEQPPPLKE